MRGFSALPFLLLPLQSAWFMPLLGLLGVWAVWRGYRPWAGWFALAALLGIAGQFWSPAQLYTRPTPPAYVAWSEGGGNWIAPADLAALHGWNPKDERGGWAVALGDGFWRLPRYNPRSGLEQTEFLTDHRYPLEAGQTYIQSFYLRHDGTQARVQITFFTQQGHHPVPTQMEPVAPGVYRVWGSYTAQEGDGALRAIDFLNQGGDFTYLEVGWAQLEVGSQPGPYRPGPAEEVPPWLRAWAWASQVLLAWLALVGVGFWRRYLEARWVAAFLLLGLALHLGYALWQLEISGMERAMGFTPQPNLLGHTAVMVAGVVWWLGGWRWGLVALLAAGLGVMASGSRTAFLALWLLGLFWAWSLPQGRRWVLLVLGVTGLVLWRWPEGLGRLGQLGLDLSGQARLQFWQVAWEAFAQHPWSGVGWGHFPLFFCLNLPEDFIEFPTHAHNLFFSLLAEGGVVLLGAFLALCLPVLYALLRRGLWPAVALWGLALGLNLLDYTFFYAGVFGPLWLGVGWALGPVQYPRERDRDLSR